MKEGEKLRGVPIQNIKWPSLMEIAIQFRYLWNKILYFSMHKEDFNLQ